MTQPLALVLYENLLPGSQLTNRLKDLGYRVATVGEPQQLVARAEAEKPIVLIAELGGGTTDVCALVRELRANPATGHIPVLAFTASKSKDLQAPAVDAGVTLVASDVALLSQLPRLLEQVLEVN